MDITIYLPDEIGRRAKKADLPLSRMLRDAVEEELRHRAAVEELSKGAKQYLLDVEDDHAAYTARLTGTLISEDVYLTDDERLFVYDAQKLQLVQVHNPEDLVDWLDTENYVQAMTTLGLTPVVDV